VRSDGEGGRSGEERAENTSSTVMRHDGCVLAQCDEGNGHAERVVLKLVARRARERTFTHSSRIHLLPIVILLAQAYTSFKYLKLILVLVVVLKIVLIVVIDVAEFILLFARFRHEWKLHLFRILIEPI